MKWVLFLMDTRGCPRGFFSRTRVSETTRGVDRGGGQGPGPPYGSQIYIENLIKFLYKLAWLAPPNNEKNNFLASTLETTGFSTP